MYFFIFHILIFFFLIRHLLFYTKEMIIFIFTTLALINIFGFILCNISGMQKGICEVKLFNFLIITQE